jgi:alpha-glucosidase
MILLRDKKAFTYNPNLIAMKSFLIFVLASVFAAIPVAAQKNISLSSPDGRIVFSLKLLKGAAAYSISFKGKPLVENSALSLKFDHGEFNNWMKIMNWLLAKPNWYTSTLKK